MMLEIKNPSMLEPWQLKYLEKNEKEFLLKARSYYKYKLDLLRDGIIESRKYTPEEFQEAYDYYKNLDPVPSVELGFITKSLWKKVLERVLRYKHLEDCPELALTRLEQVSRVGF